MGIQIDAIRSLEALRLVTFTLLIENVQLNSNIWITSRNSPAFSRRINKFNKKEEKQTRLLVYLFPVVQITLYLGSMLSECMSKVEKVVGVIEWTKKNFWIKNRFECSGSYLRRFFYPKTFIKTTKHEPKTLPSTKINNQKQSGFLRVCQREDVNRFHTIHLKPYECGIHACSKQTVPTTIPRTGPLTLTIQSNWMQCLLQGNYTRIPCP